MKRQYSSHFTEAGEAAARGEPVTYRQPRPAAENDELTAALLSMRTAAAHNFRNLKKEYIHESN